MYSANFALTELSNLPWLPHNTRQVQPNPRWLLAARTAGMGLSILDAGARPWQHGRLACRKVRRMLPRRRRGPMVVLYHPCPKRHRLWGELWWVEEEHRWMFFDDLESILMISLGGCCPAVVCLAYRTGAGGSVTIMPLACAARHQKRRLAMVAFRWRSWLGLAVALFLVYG